ncbi:MAG: carbon-nitrogen hydrolase family protein [Halothermotrichaceae bacterium]
MNTLNIGLIQMMVVDDKDKNLSKAEEMIRKAAAQGAQLIVLPEMFNCPYDINKFADYAEESGGNTWQLLSDAARKNNVYLIGGSIPEIDKNESLYNTSFCFDNNGKEIAKHRKIHLFDVDIENGQTFQESRILTPGNDLTIFDIPFAKIGVVICYDLRFPELARLMVKSGVQIIVVPGAFNMTTGPAHWEILFRTRAVDNQVYMIGTAPARNTESSYTSYGNSIIVNPWGKVVDRLGKEEKILLKEIDINYIHKIRKELPLLKHTRNDLYRLKLK